MPEPSRQLAAIMFTDIVGYTALMGKDSAKALELVRISKGIQKPLVEKHNGQWLKEMGDGAMAKFSTALDAVNCAVEIQEVARGKLDGKLRIGIHLGDITIKEDDVYGDGVNVASRLESIADPGGIYISESIEKAIQGQTDVQAKYLGEVKLKNVAYGVRTYAVQGVGMPVPEIKEDQHLKGHLWAEVQRRGVLRAGATYIVLSLLAILLLPFFESMISLPQWSATALLGVLVAGFPTAMYLAWNYERSPEGFVKTSSQQSWQNPYSVSQRKPFTGTFIIAGLVGIIVVMYLYPRLSSGGQSAEPLDKSIAVLPFANLSNDPDQEYFSIGMMEEILNHLYRIEDLRVPSRTTSMKYQDAKMSATEIAAEIGVSHILEGSVRKDYDRIRITVQLIDAVNDKHLWAQSYDGSITDTIFVIQSNIAKKIAASLEAVITTEVEQRIDKIPTTDVAAYDFYIRAEHERWQFQQTLDQNHLEKAHDLLDKALEIDPDYLMAIVGKGQVFNNQFMPDSALAYADRAIALDPEFNRSYGLKGYYYQLSGNADLALEHFLKAIQLPPKDDWWYHYHTAIGNLYSRKNEVIKALPYFRKGVEKKDNQYVGGGYIMLGLTYMRIGDYERAEQYIQLGDKKELACPARNLTNRITVIQGKFQEALQFAESQCQQPECKLACFADLFQSSILAGEYKKALQYYQQFHDAGPRDKGLLTKGTVDHQIGLVYYRLGKNEEGNRAFEDEIQRLEADSTNRRYNWRLARMHAFQGHRDEALKYLAHYAELGFSFGNHDFILIDPFFESLWNDPEFQAIVKKAQEEKAALRAQVREMEERGELDL